MDIESRDKMDYKLIEVTWIDAWLDGEHLPLSAVEKAKPIERRNTGYLLKEDANCIVMTFGFIGDNECDMLFTLPKIMIVGSPRELK